MVQQELPPGLEFERLLASHERSTLLLVRRGAQRLVLRLADGGAAPFAELLPFATVAHPALVAPLEWGTTGGGQAYVLREYAPGQVLEEALATAPDRAAALVDISASLLQALDALHAAGFVHRDVKGSNVIVSDAGARLIDFEFSILGIAGGGEALGDVPSAPAGTRGYLAPEVLLGHPHTPAADLFALGAMLAYACLGPASTAFAERFPEVAFFAAAGLDGERLPPQLAPLVRALVRRHPADRPSSARAALALLPGHARTPAPALRLPAFAGRAEAFGSAVRSFSASRKILVLSVEDETELESAARELQLRLALGAAPTRAPGLRGSPGAAPVVRVAFDVSTAEASLRAALASDGASLALVASSARVAEALVTLRAELAPSESELLHVLELPRVSEAALAAHLDGLAQGVSPVAARRLAASLYASTRGRISGIQGRLDRAVEDGVLRAGHGGFALLVDAWPEAPRSNDDSPRDGARADFLGVGPDAHGVLCAVAVLGAGARPGWVSEVAALDAPALARGVLELSQRGVLELALGSFVVTERDWLTSSLAALTPAAIAALHGRAARALATAGAPTARVVLHELEAGATKAGLAAALELAEAERCAGHLGTARELVRAVLARGPRRGSALRDRAATIVARIELGQVDASAALAALRAARGERLEGAPNALLQVAGEAAETAGERAFASECYARILASEPDVADAHRATLGIAYAAWLDGDAAGALDRTAGLPSERTPVETAGAIWNLRAGALARLGRFAESVTALEHAGRAAAASGDPTLRGRTELNSAYLARRQGDLLGAVAALERAREAFELAGHVKMLSLTANNGGVLQRDLGRLASAETLLRNALAHRRRTGDAHGTAVSMSNLGVLALDAGRIGSALRWLDDARALLERGGYRDELALVACSEAAALALAGRDDDARDALQRAAPARRARPLLHAFASALVDVGSSSVAVSGAVAPAAPRDTRSVVGEDRAAALLQRALEAPSRGEDLADRFRAARLLRALRPDSARALETLAEAGRLLGSAERRAEVEWFERCGAPHADADELLAHAATFDDEGRTELARVVALRLGELLQRGGRAEERRRAMARADAAVEVLLEGLPAERGPKVLALIDRLAGRSAAPDATRRSEPGIEAEWFLAWNRRLARGLDLPALLRATVEKALAVTGAERGFLVLLDEGEVELLVGQGMDDGARSPEDLRFSRTVVREAVRRGRPIVTADVVHDRSLRAAESIRALGTRAVVCVPLPDLETSSGALYVDRAGAVAAFDDYDVRALGTLADQAAIGVTSMRRQADIEQLTVRLRERLEFREGELTDMRHALRDCGAAMPVGGLVGTSDALRQLNDRVTRLASSELSVLLQGPRGSAFDAVARALHERGTRAEGPYLACDLSALAPEEQAEELFGRSREATPAGGRQRLGLLARAHQGTLFLDGIDALEPALHVRLLDALDTGRHRAEGSVRVRRGETRLVVASREDVHALAREGRFDPELLHSLDGATVRVPALAERVEDVPHIVRRLLDELNERHRTDKRVSPEVLAALTRRPWPGELRELRNEVARLYFLSDAALDRPEDVRAPLHGSAPADRMPASFLLADVERAAVTRALEAAGNNKGRAAALLGISRAGLYKKLERLGIRAATR